MLTNCHYTHPTIDHFPTELVSEDAQTQVQVLVQAEPKLEPVLTIRDINGFSRLS